MVAYFFVAIFTLSVIIIFTKGFLFALCFLGTCSLPCVAVAGGKWGILRGDMAQKIGVPVIAVGILAFAYWLSKSVGVEVFGLYLSGFALWLISATFGLIGVPLEWAQNPNQDTTGT